MEWSHPGYAISTDANRLDREVIHAFLSGSYWAKGIPREVLDRAIANSLCFGVYEGTRQVGFARVITDKATYGYLADVFVLESHRGKGLGKWLVEVILAHPELSGLRRWGLVTWDAHGLYAQHGFGPLSRPRAPHGDLRPGHLSQADGHSTGTLTRLQRRRRGTISWSFPVFGSDICTLAAFALPTSTISFSFPWLSASFSIALPFLVTPMTTWSSRSPAAAKAASPANPVFGETRRPTASRSA